jgi:hypothetical protein
MYHLLVLISVVTAAVSTVLLSQPAFGSVATIFFHNCSGPLKADFSTYWLCARYLLLGGNPFDPTEIKTFATSLGCELTGPSYISPWFLVLLFPLASLPLNIAATIWFVLNLVMIFDITAWTLKSLARARPPRPTLVLALAASPGAFVCLLYGQFGIACLWGMSMVARSYERGSRFVSLALIIGSLKPHIGWLYWLAAGKLLAQGRRFRVLAYTLSLVLLSVLFITFWAPGSYESWRQVYGSALLWMGASVTTAVRILVASAGDPAPVWPVIVIMTFAMIFTARRLSKRKLDLAEELPWLTAISICTTPYVWSFDFCVLLPAEVLALSSLLAAEDQRGFRRLLSPALIMLARLGLLVQLMAQIGDWRTWWYPPIVTLALFHHLSRARSTAQRTHTESRLDATHHR